MMVEKMILPVIEEEMLTTVIIPKTEAGFDFIFDLLENMRMKSIKNERPDK